MAIIRSHQGSVDRRNVEVFTCRDEHHTWIELQTISGDGDEAVIEISLDGLMELHTLFGELKRLYRPTANRLSQAQDRP
jgi:hypothetical protein